MKSKNSNFIFFLNFKVKVIRIKFTDCQCITNYRWYNPSCRNFIKKHSISLGFIPLKVYRGYIKSTRCLGDKRRGNTKGFYFVIPSYEMLQVMSTLSIQKGYEYLEVLSKNWKILKMVKDVSLISVL